MTHPPDERGLELRELFFETSQELLQALNEESLKLEKHPGDEEIVRSIRRTVHTLKGDSAACGLREISELAHHFENALSLEGAAAHAALAEISFAAADVFTAMIAAYHSGGNLPDSEPLRRRIDQMTSAPAKPRRGKKKSEASLPGAKAWTQAETAVIARAQAAGLALYEVVAKIDPHCTMPIAARQLIHNALSEIGEVFVTRPDVKSPAATKQVEFIFTSAQTKDLIAAKCHIPTITGDVHVTLLQAASPAKVRTVEEPVDAPGMPAASIEPAPQPATKIVEAAPTPEAAQPQILTENILRVEAGRIDNVLNLVGELIIGKSMLQQALNEFAKRYPKETLRGKFADAMAFQARVLNDLQRSVMKIRMVPVDQLFRRFPRIVRDVARQCGREVELELSGQETDLDKGILDAIAEPLTHLVRNAVSHGIESADERRRQGKPAQGKIRLNAYHHGNQVVVEISDDGRGIDARKIRDKAIQLGMTSAEEAARLSEGEIFDFIFRPGFSTAEVVTEVSGRGVGMDVVQSVLQRLKATIQVETHLGQGTTFRLKLPLTLAIIKALMFWVEQRLYAIPLNAVSQIARTRESEVHQVDNYEVLQLRDQVLPLLRLGRPPAPEIDRKSAKLFVLVITVGEKRYGLIVDSVDGEEELVIKALDDQTFSTDLVNGASILGDGKVVLILNLPAVVEHVARSRPEKTGTLFGGLLLNQADRARLALGTVEGHA
ncbi:MAG TPA: chemotaxis protein CheA [Candidatus Binatia bacterium]|nr:chemotaxis protein CheA [Candidatus Binatia bacterium]